MSDIEKPKRPKKTKPILKFFGKCMASIMAACIFGFLSYAVFIAGEDTSYFDFVLHQGITGLFGVLGYTVGFQLFDGMHGVGFDFDLNF